MEGLVMKKRSPESDAFGKRLQRFRYEKNLSVADIASSVGVAPSTYREWELGRAITGLPYKALMSKFNVSPSELFGIEGAAQNEVLEKLRAIEKLILEIKSTL